MLCAVSQAISLIQHNDLGLPLGEGYFLLGEGLDLVPDHVDPSFVGGVELESGLFELGLEQLSDDAEHA